MEKFTLADVSNVVEVPTHVILYWEIEFPQIKVKKDEFRQRVYTQKDLDVIMHIKYLLFEKRYSIEATKIELAKEFE